VRFNSAETQALIQRASAVTLGTLFAQRVRVCADQIAIEFGDLILTYAQLNDRVNRLAQLMMSLGLSRGDRVAILAENRNEYTELELASAKVGLIVATINWRLAPGEVQHCLDLVEPRLVFVSEHHMQTAARIDLHDVPVVVFGGDYEARLATMPPEEPHCEVDNEDGLLLLYTSGTTGLPKAALISHRAIIARASHRLAQFGLKPGMTSLAWPPMYHMTGTEDALQNAICGGKTIITDGFDPVEVAEILRVNEIGWLRLMPGMVATLLDELKRRNIRPTGIRLCGVMPDLVPPTLIAEVSEWLDAPFANTFGATETGTTPASGSVIAIGEIPTDLAKTQSIFCELRLVDENDEEVPDGTPGEAAVRGAMLFSGYWNAPDVNARDFRNGWFHMGDLLVRKPDGRLAFVDRLKYMIKSGGENIYPAEIERVLLGDPDVADAVVVKAAHARWGETPVAFVARKTAGVTAERLRKLCRASLASFKQPSEIYFVPFDSLPRSTSGKIQRSEIEQWIVMDKIPRDSFTAEARE